MEKENKMRVMFIFDDGSTFETGEDDWIGVRLCRDEASGSRWTTACNTKKTLFQELEAGKWLFVRGKNSIRAIDPSRVVEVTVIDEWQEIPLWLRDVCSSKK